MQPSLYWMVTTMFVSALTFSGSDSVVSAERQPRFITTEVDQAGLYRCVLTTAGEKAEPESGETSSINTPGQPEKREPSTTEAADEVQKLKLQLIDVQNKGKLRFRQIVRCRSVEGFGVYSPLEGGEQGPRLVFYCEPSNVSTMISEGRYIIDCSVDAFIVDSAGKVLLAREGVVKLNRVSRCPIMDLYFKIELNMQKLAGRSLLVKIVLNDKIKNQSVSALERVNAEDRKPIQSSGRSLQWDSDGDSLKGAN